MHSENEAEKLFADNISMYHDLTIFFSLIDIDMSWRSLASLFFISRNLLVSENH